MKQHRVRIFLLRRRWAAAVLILLGCGLLAAAMGLPAAVTASAPQRQLPIYSVERPKKLCAISFDAAWGADQTQTILDTLAKYDVKATFFVVGRWAEEFPDQVKAIHEAGHEVMNHSDGHGHYNTMTADEITADLRRCNQKVAAITGKTPTLVRCPYGEFDDHVIAAVRSLGMEPIQWDVDSLDWKKIPADQITERVTEKLRPGSIVLFHNAAPHTPQALPEILTFMIHDGYTIVPISQLIYPADYTIDHTGRQFSAQTK